jgi:hypothetical protein
VETIILQKNSTSIIFIDEIDGSDNEVHRTMLQIVTETGRALTTRAASSKVLMATNRPDTLDPALLPSRPCSIARSKLGLSDLERSGHIFSKIPFVAQEWRPGQIRFETHRPAVVPPTKTTRRRIAQRLHRGRQHDCHSRSAQER